MIKAYSVDLEHKQCKAITKQTLVIATKILEAKEKAERANPGYQAVLVHLSESACVKMG